MRRRFPARLSPENVSQTATDSGIVGSGCGGSGTSSKASGALALAGPQRVVAHLALHAARVDPIAARNKALLKNFVEDRFVEYFSLPRGE